MATSCALLMRIASVLAPVSSATSAPAVAVPKSRRVFAAFHVMRTESVSSASPNHRRAAVPLGEMSDMPPAAATSKT